MPDFQLHPRLQQDCLHVAQLGLSQLLMMNDSQYPWFILVPRRAGISEIYQLVETDRQRLWAESCLLAEQLQTLYRPDKLNIAAIGNLVPQLHLHHLVRYRQDASWPAPVWGQRPPQPYAQTQANTEIAKLREALASSLID